MALNKVILIGNLTKDVEVKMVGEAKLASFTLAVNRLCNTGRIHPDGAHRHRR